MNSIRDNHQRSKNAILLVIIVLVLQLVSIIPTIMQMVLVNKIFSGEQYTVEEVQLNGVLALIVNILVLVATITSGVFFILWFRRAYYNLEQKTFLTSYSNGWAAGAWFVPILNLFRPYQIMNELFTITPKVLKKNDIKTDFELEKSTIATWWTLWIITLVVGNVSSRMVLNAGSAKSFNIASIFDIISCLLFIPLSIITIKVIVNYTKYALYIKEVGNERHFDAFVDEHI
ncbi:MAG: DUF4328 domain-containing protein [Bacteroidota bacterium]